MTQYGSSWAFSTTSSLESDSVTTCRSQASGSSWVVTLSIPLAAVCSWITASLSPRNMTCARRPVTVTPQKKGTCKDSNCTVDIFQRSVTGYKDVSTDIEQALMLAAAQQPMSTAIEADNARFNHARLVCWSHHAARGRRRWRHGRHEIQELLGDRSRWQTLS